MRAFASVVLAGWVGSRSRPSSCSRCRSLVLPLAVVGVLVAAWGAGAGVSVRGVTTRASGRADAQPGAADISADGRYVVFVSLRKGFLGSVLVHDRQTGRTTVASVTGDGSLPDGSSGRLDVLSSYVPVGISSGGRYVGFTSWASNLVAGDAGGLRSVARLFVRDMQAGVTTEVGGGYFAAMSADGRKVAFFGGSGTTGGGFELFVRDLVSGVTTAASVAPDGAQANSLVSPASLSANGRFVAFSSYASHLVPGDTNSHEVVFVRDLQSGVTSLVSVALDGGSANGDSGTPAISADGRYVAFESDASDLVRGDTNESRDVFVRDLLTGKTTRVSVSSNGGEGWSPGYPVEMNWNGVAISADGRVVAFVSDLNGLVRRDDNEIPDVFVRDRGSGVTSLVSVASTGVGANGPSLGAIAISGHGRDIAFGSGATNLVSRPKLVNWGVYVRDRLATRR